MKTAFLVDDNVVHGESPLSCVHSANSERGHLPWLEGLRQSLQVGDVRVAGGVMVR